MRGVLAHMAQTATTTTPGPVTLVGPTYQAAEAVQRAVQRATTSRSSVGPDEMLLALVEGPDNDATQVLDILGVSVPSLRHELQQLSGLG